MVKYQIILKKEMKQTTNKEFNYYQGTQRKKSELFNPSQ